jgi:hypothetical protein
MKRALVVGLVTLAMSACGEGTSDSSASNSSQRVGDTTFVFSSVPLRGTATLREVSRIGMIDGPPEYLLGTAPAFTVGSDGSLFVADRGTLRHYDADGKYVRTIARQGQGPGEMRSVVSMDVSDDGLVAALDLGNRRVNVFSPDGTLVREFRLGAGPAAGRPAYGRDAIRWDDYGQLWIALNPPRRGADTLGTGQRPVFGRLAGHEEVTDTVFLPARAREGCERRLPSYSGGFMEDNRLRHMPFAQWSRSRMGVLAFGCSASFTIDVARPNGGVTRMSKEWEPPVRTDEEYEYWSDGFRGANLQRRRNNEILASLGRSAEVMPIPPIPILPRERPAFLRLWLTDNGRLWAWPAAPGWSRAWTEEELGFLRQQAGGERVPPQFWEYWNPTDGFEVFDTDGRWIGHVNTPETWATAPYPGRGDPYFRGDTVWAVVREEFDVRYIVRFQVEWPSPE